jgi:16S rRNA processing protein RimM
MVVVGRIQGPYGIKGWVHVASFTDPRENIQAYSPWLIGDESVANSWRPLEVEQIRPHKQGYVAKLVGVNDRNAADGMKGLLIAVPETSLPRPEPGEFYWRELVGASVVNSDGACLGRVRGLIETGANDVLVIERADAMEDGQAVSGELLIPFHARFVLDVDRDAGVILVEWQTSEED